MPTTSSAKRFYVTIKVNTSLVYLTNKPQSNKFQTGHRLPNAACTPSRTLCKSIFDSLPIRHSLGLI